MNYYFVDDASILGTFLQSIRIIILLKIMKTRIMQVHIVQRGAVPPLIEMLQSSDVQLKEMSAFALGRLAQVCISLMSFRVKTVNLDGIRKNCKQHVCGRT